MLLRCGMKPGDCRHIQGTAVGVQGSATDPILMYTGPHAGMCRPWGEPRVEKDHAAYSLAERKSSTAGLTRRTARREEKEHRAGGARRKWGANVDLTQSYQ